MSVTELVKVAGARAVEHAPFGERTTYRVGGAARVLVTLETLDDLKELSPLIRDAHRPVVTLGNGSNMLVSDDEFDGIVLVLGEHFTQLTWRDADDVVIVEAGSALDLPVAARRLVEAGLSGFEWAVGVPGTFGGAAVMNAGGHGSDMAHCVRRVSTWSLRRDRVEDFSAEQMEFGYRSSALGADDLVVSVSLALRRGTADQSRQILREIVSWRRTHQPGGSNAGSVFRNPPGDFAGRLIDEAGCKDLVIGSARVSDKHANFFLVASEGSASDVVALMSEVRRRVYEHSGVTLTSEVRTIGFEGRWP